MERRIRITVKYASIASTNTKRNEPENPGGKDVLPTKLPLILCYLRCRTGFCDGTAKKLTRNAEIIENRRHLMNCYADNHAQLKADFLQALKAALKRNFWKLKDLYDTVVVMYPRIVKVLIPYNSILSSLKHWRRRFYPPSPNSLAEMGHQLCQPENERLLGYDQGRLVPRMITDRDGNLHLLIFDPQFIQNEFATVSKLFIDGTFQTTPRVTGVYQLVSFLGVKFDHALPFAHILMSNKSQSAYTAVLDEIANLIDSASVTVVMTDFEQALRNSCRGVFVNAYITGCNTHYDRALLKKVKTLRLTAILRDNNVAKVFIEKTMALAYLPADMIEAEFTSLKEALPPPIKRSFAGFIAYYTRQWLRIVKPTGFSVFGMSRRTNNVIESYNSVLAGKLGVHPSAWTFVVKLLNLTSNARDDVRSLTLSKRIKRHPRYATAYKQKQIINAWKQLYARDITPAEFLEKAAMLRGHMVQRIRSITDDDLNHTVEMDQTPNNVPFDDPDYDRQIFENLRFNDANELAEHENVDAAAERDHVDAQVEADNYASDIDDAELEGERVASPIEPRRLVDDNDVELAENRVRGPIKLQPFNDIENAQSEAESVPGLIEPQLMNEDLEVPAAVAREPMANVSASRKKNLRKKRRHQKKAQGQEILRPYGHKRRRTAKNEQGQKCVVCKTNPITHGFVPCGHVCCCFACGSVLAEQELQRCPKCRLEFTLFMAMFNE